MQSKEVNLFILVLLLNFSAISAQNQDYWQLSSKESILLDLTKTDKPPHNDNIEMAGKNIATIINYSIDADRNLTIDKDFIFPQLRIFNKSNEPDWKKYRAYFRRKVTSKFSPLISSEDLTIVPAQTDSIRINGMITFYYTPVKGLKITKKLYPSPEDRFVVEEWTIENVSEKNKDISISNIVHKESEKGYKGDYSFIVESRAKANKTLAVGESYTFPVYYGALMNEEKTADFDYQKAKKGRLAFLKICQDNLVLKTPNKVLNQLFYFSKIRASESIYNSSLGLIHSPGGGNYYVGIWANDQVEYSGPFFPYLGYQNGNIAAYNTYKMFLQNIPKDDGHIPYAFEVDGNFPMTHLDRGDAAMIAYGTSQYLLASGNVEQAKELWPLIEWSLEYCHRKRNAAGAVQSASDEMEGRIETGTANLSTSALYYGGLKYSQYIAQELNLPKKSILYKQRMLEMEKVIEDYFGATLEGLNTYKYYDENKLLRHWICLPLVMGIEKRKDETAKALFEKLWTDNGILVEYNPEIDIDKAVFWDRATLYALRGVMHVGEVELGYQKLLQYSQKRLLGDHVPYAVEAYPENNMKHLSAESALYCRILTEGLLGIEPIGFSTIEISPNLPSAWDHLELNQVYLCGKVMDIKLSRVDNNLKMHIQSGGNVLFDDLLKVGEVIKIEIPAG